MIKDRRVVLRMDLLQLKFKNKNLLVKMSTFVFISINSACVRGVFFLKTRLIRTHGMSHWCPYYLVSTVVVMVVTTWGRGRTRASGNGSGSGSVDGRSSVSGGAWW